MTDIKSDVDRYGFERSEDFDFESYEAFMSEYLSVLAKRLMKWEKIMKANGLSKSRKVKRYVRKGIPSELRSEVWLNVSSAKRLQEEYPNKYNDFINNSSLEKKVIDAIDGDIHRTFPENIYFHELRQDNLLKPMCNVLRAYAQYNPDIGYCQGLNYIVGMLLLQTKNECDSFWLLVELMDKYVPNFYSGKMLALRVECSVLDYYISSLHPRLHAHFQKHGIDMQLFVSKWFVCLFMDVLPVETVLRIWDCLFYEGSKILLRTAFTLIVASKDEFLQTDDFTKMCELFKKIVKDNAVMDCHTFLQKCFTIPKAFSRSKIKKLREQYTLKLTNS